jgi:hypothetical protein
VPALPQNAATALREIAAAFAVHKPLAFWSELHDTASLVALGGHAGPALRLWELARDSRVVREQLSVHGDAAVAAACVATGRDDLSRGDMMPRGAKAGMNLSERVAGHDAWIRRNLTPYNAYASRRATPEALELRILALELASPRDDGSPSEREGEALELILQYFALVEARPLHYEGLQALVLAADIAARAQNVSLAKRLLERWYIESATGRMTLIDQVLGLRSLAPLVFGGALGEVMHLDAASAVESVGAIERTVRRRLDANEPVNPARKGYAFCASYAQFYLECATCESEAPIPSEEDLSRGFIVSPGRVTVYLPDDEWSCELVVVEEGPREADRTLRFTLDVAGDLFVRTADYHGDELRLDVAPGKYAATASFVAMEDRWRVELHLADS